MRYAVAMLLIIVGIVEFFLRFLLMLVLVVTIIGLVFLDDVGLALLTPMTWTMARDVLEAKR